MLGAIIGDIAGSRFEFNPTNDYHFEFFAAGCGYTDDTICTVAVMDAILQGADFGASLHQWCRRYPHPLGAYGGRFRAWVESRNPRPYNSFGNGSAMRVSPVAWAFRHSSSMLSKATLSAACTHNHPEGIKGARTVALAIHTALELKRSHDTFGPAQLQHLLDTCATFSGYNLHIRRADVQNHFDETCQGTVPVALWIIGQSRSFEDAVRRAVSLGADADTLGAIVGSIAEAIWGIPDEMATEALTYLPDEMRAIVTRFYQHFGPHARRSAAPSPAAAPAPATAPAPTAQPSSATAIQPDESITPQELQSLMFWQLGLGHMDKHFTGADPMPDRRQTATRSSWKVEDMPRESVSTLPTHIFLTEQEMQILRRGHIPEAMEDHWFMYCDAEYIRYYRSWTGACAFEAHFTPVGDHWRIDTVAINHTIANYGANRDATGLSLFLYLLTAETGGNAAAAWRDHLATWAPDDSKPSPSSPSEEATQ